MTALSTGAEPSASPAPDHAVAPLPATPTLTVVIPTLDEESRLPDLLACLARQTRRPEAIIVADAGSTDRTREIARAAGALVVDGGKPARGRNAGAAAATTDLVLFLDADDDPAEDWIDGAVTEFVERELFSAAGQVEPIEDTPANRVACEAVNLYLLLMQYVAPHAPGFCIMVRRDVHEHIGGFDETVVLAEDHEYVQRAAEVGKFRILNSAPMRTSMRRIEKEGLVTLAFKYLYSELYVVTGRPVKSVPFEYEFAAFGEQTPAETPAERTGVLVDFAALRERLGKLTEPVATFSAGELEKLKSLGSTAAGPEAVDARLERLAPEELRALHRYLTRRADIARRMPPIVLRRVRRAGERIVRTLADDTGREV